MGLLVALFMIGTGVAFFAWVIHPTKQNFKTFIVALVLTLIVAAFVGNSASAVI